MKNNIDTTHWKWFRIKDIFKIKKSKNINSDDAKESIGYEVPYVTRTEFNNGIKFFVCKQSFNTNKGNCITIGGEGANIFYQPKEFITGNNITLIWNENLNENVGLFIVAILNLEKFRYSYNRAFTKSNIESTKIKLPVDENGNPDWEFMENYIQQLRERERESSELAQSCLKNINLELNINKWKEFLILNLFSVKGSNSKYL